MTDVELHRLSTTRRPSWSRAARRPGPRRRDDRPDRRLDDRARLRARRGGERRLERLGGLVGRRALRAARRRALQLRARQAHAARPARSSSPRSTGSAASSTRPRLRPSTSRSSTASSSTCCCSASAPTGTSPRSSPARRSSRSATRLVTSGPAGLEPFVDRVTLTLPVLLSAPRIVVPRHGRRESRRRRARLPRADHDRGAGEPASRRRDGAIVVFLDRDAAGAL